MNPEAVEAALRKATWSGSTSIPSSRRPEVAVLYALRSSDDPDTVLIYTKAEWDAFTQGAQAGEFDDLFDG